MNEINDSINRIIKYIKENKKRPTTVKYKGTPVPLDKFLALPTLKEAKSRYDAFLKTNKRYPETLKIGDVDYSKEDYSILYNLPVVSKHISHDDVYDYFCKKFKEVGTIDEALKLINGRGYGHYFNNKWSNKQVIDQLKKGNANVNCLSGNNKIVIRNKKDKTVFSVRLDDFVENYDYSNYEVPTVNLETDKMEWKQILNAFQSGTDIVYRIKFAKGFIVEATADHKFIRATTRGKSIKKNPYLAVKDFMNGKKNRLLNNTNLYSPNEHKNYYLSALFGFFLGDGSINRQNNGYISFGFSKDRKVKYLRYLLEKCGLEYKYSFKKTDRYKNGKRHDFYLKTRIYPNLSKSELINHYKNKLNYKGLLEGLINSDGMVRLVNTDTLELGFYNTNKNIMDLYVLSCLCCGIRPSILLNKRHGGSKDVYQSTAYGENVLKLLSEMTFFDEYKEYINNSNKNPRKYNDISYITPKSVTEIGEMPVYNLSIEDNHNYMAGVNGFVLVKNCTDIHQTLFHIAKALGYDVKIMHVKCKGGDGHIRMDVRHPKHTGGNWIHRDGACVISPNGNPITCCWCLDGKLIDTNPKWFNDTINY